MVDLVPQQVSGRISSTVCARESPWSTTLSGLTYADVGQTERTGAGGTAFQDAPFGLVAATTGDTTYWTRDSSGTLVSQRAVTTSGTTRRYYLFDGLGSTTGLVTTAGALAGGYRYRYDPYGNLVSGGTPPTNPWRYASGYHDAGTGLTKFGTRYYDPGLGRWTQQDPIAGSITSPGSFNRYVYARNSPTSVTDPSGLYPQDCSSYSYAAGMDPVNCSSTEYVLQQYSGGFIGWEAATEYAGSLATAAYTAVACFGAGIVAVEATGNPYWGVAFCVTYGGAALANVP